MTAFSSFSTLDQICFPGRLDLGLKRVEPRDRLGDSEQIVCFFGPTNFGA